MEECHKLRIITQGNIRKMHDPGMSLGAQIDSKRNFNQYIKLSA